ncbi:MAG: polyprenyl synthetase family protein [Myxococcota bacterium]
MDVQAYISERTPLVDRELEAFLPPASQEPRSLHEAMRHLVFPGGKRIRPLFAMAAAEAIGASPEQALPVGVAVELIHTYSLIHDDLPCMDDDDLRRSRPTVHVAYGEAVAVLAGDALLTAAFEVVSAAAGSHGAERAVAAIRELARVAGASGLVGGQIDDLAFDRDKHSVAALEFIHERKSAALIAGAIAAGAGIAGADEALCERLRRFGYEVGVAFQIADDLLDAEDDGPCSLVTVLGSDAARQRAEALLGTALGRVEDLGEPAEPLRELARYAVRRDR